MIVFVLSIVLGAGAMVRNAGWMRVRPHSARASGSFVPSREEMHLPRVMLWAWERPEDLRFLSPHTAGVAFLAGTIDISSIQPETVKASNASVVLHPRLQPLLVPPGTALMAVVRIETPNDLWHQAKNRRDDIPPISSGPPYSNAQRFRVADMIASVATLPGVRAVQVDYDATQGERTFYRELLEDVRKRLPQGMPLSITALASWCIGDTWLDTLPGGTINEAVPMLFRMGPDAARVAAFLQAGNQFPPLICRTSIGVSTDEIFSQTLLSGSVGPSAGRWNYGRVYIFSNRAWTDVAVKQIAARR